MALDKSFGKSAALLQFVGTFVYIYASTLFGSLFFVVSGLFWMGEGLVKKGHLSAKVFGTSAGFLSLAYGVIALTSLFVAANPLAWVISLSLVGFLGGLSWYKGAVPAEGEPDTSSDLFNRQAGIFQMGASVLSLLLPLAAVILSSIYAAPILAPVILFSLGLATLIITALSSFTWLSSYYVDQDDEFKQEAIVEPLLIRQDVTSAAPTFVQKTKLFDWSIVKLETGQLRDDKDPLCALLTGNAIVQETPWTCRIS